MPELPEVETVVRDLRAAGLAGRAIRRVRVLWPKTVVGLTPRRFIRLLTGARIRGLARRAKYIVIALANGHSLLIHLRMTGQIHLTRRSQPANPHDRIILELDNGRALHFRDTRKFGRWHLTRDPAAVIGRLGPEPLARSFTTADLAARLTVRQRLLKPLLLDQTVLAGLGNIYADEALWLARLHPLRNAATLRRMEIAALFRAIRQVLRRGIANQGTSLGAGRSNFSSAGGRRGRNQEYLRVFRRTGAACPRCRTPIRRLLVGQRSTHICPRCQPAPHAGRGKERT